ncbi:MAG: cyanophycinase [Chloroflexota bacterium]|jgi:cyanophycinase|nr:cyanophycinase [Chloroflexota bacterium]
MRVVARRRTERLALGLTLGGRMPTQLGTPDGYGPLALVGGDEFHPGNEPQDRLLVEAARVLGGDRPALVIATAAARHQPERAVDTARGWFAELGLPVEELPVRRRGQASDPGVVELARLGRFFYLVGGDPGIVPTTLHATPAWAAVLDAWRAGAPLAGSSAGAMALGEWTLIRARVPGDSRRQARDGLAVVPGIAVLPHYETFGHRWVPSAAEAVPGGATLLGVDERSAAVWTGGKWRAMGAGGVTVIHGTPGPRFEAESEIDGLPQPA